METFLQKEMIERPHGQNLGVPVVKYMFSGFRDFIRWEASHSSTACALNIDDPSRKATQIVLP